MDRVKHGSTCSFCPNLCRGGLKVQIPGGDERRVLGEGSKHLVHLDEEAVNEVSGMVGVKGCLVDLHSGCNKVLKILYHIVEVFVSSWQILHDS